MDIFTMKNEEVRKLDTLTFQRMVQYAWLKYNLQRVDLPYRGGKKKGQSEDIDWLPDSLED